MKTSMKFMPHFLSLVCIAMLYFSCAKDGEDGAIGPQGPQGEQGPAGPQGQDGVVDTANVIYSSWMDFNWNTPINSDTGLIEVSASTLTQEIIDTGVLLVFARQGGTTYALPVALDAITGQESYVIQIVDIGSFEIVVQDLEGSDVGTPFLSSEFRYVIIPGGTSTSGKSSIDFTKMSYNEICVHFNIPK